MGEKNFQGIINRGAFIKQQRVIGRSSRSKYEGNSGIGGKDYYNTPYLVSVVASLPIAKAAL